MDLMAVLVTGAAGFIGFHVADALASRGDDVIAIDNLNDYYDVSLKETRMHMLQRKSNIRFYTADIRDRDAMRYYASEAKTVIHLAAQAGVRHSITHPFDYTDNNIDGFLSVLEACRHENTEHLVYASTSSVYGNEQDMPFAECRGSNHPITLYAATKRANELMAHAYSDLYSIPTTGLRFFTVYGPWGRPDMALFLFTRNILDGLPINVFNHGHHVRDFTYIDDIVGGVIAAHDRPPYECDAHVIDTDPSSSSCPFRLYNLAGGSPTALLRYIRAIELATGCKAIMDMRDMQPGDIAKTEADITMAEWDLGYEPATSVKDGVAKFVDWYRDYYNK